jgi:hypothetical protein
VQVVVEVAVVLMVQEPKVLVVQAEVVMERKITPLLHKAELSTLAVAAVVVCIPLELQLRSLVARVALVS